MNPNESRRSFLKAAGGLALTVPPISMLPVACSQDNGGRISPDRRGQWTTEEAWEWHRKVGVIRGFNAPQLGHPGMTMDDVFQKAVDLGFNSVRAWMRSRETIQNYLDTAGAKGLMVSPVIDLKRYFNRSDTEQAMAEAKTLVQDLIGEFRDDPRIVFWDVWNEPAGIYAEETVDEELHWVRQTILWARQVAPVQPITASIFFLTRHFNRDGVQENRAAAEAMTDIHNFHLYDLSDNWMEAGETLIGHLKKISDRPIVCTEIVARSRGGTFGRSLSLMSRHHVHWYSWGLYVSDTNWHVAWRETAFDSLEPWFHEVLHPDGSPYDWRDLDMIRTFRFAAAGEEADPGAEVTERWNKWRSWKWMAVGPVRGWNFLPAGAGSWKDMWLAGSSAYAGWSGQVRRAQSSGCNYLRIHLDYSAWKENPEQFYAGVDEFLSTAARHNMGVMPVLMTDKDSGNTENNLIAYVSALIQRYGEDARVHSWELYNRPGGDGADENKVRSLLQSVFRAARFEFPNQPLTATPSVRVEDIPPDLDYRGAFVHGSRAGWNRLEYEGGCELSLCNYIWELSDILSLPSGRRMPETGWLLSVANRYGRPVVCTELSASDTTSAEEILDLFSTHHVYWFKEGEIPDTTAYAQFKFVQVMTRRKFGD